MKPSRYVRLVLTGAWMLCCAVSLAWAQDFGNDPVEDLRQALLIEDVIAPNQFIIDFRIKNLSKKIDALKTIGDLRRALSLEEWREDLEARNPALRQIDQEKRKQVGKRLQEAIRKRVFDGDGNSRLAVASLISEMGPTVRALDIKDRGGYARSLTPDVLRLAVNSDIGVRQEALRALGNINAPPGDASKVFSQVLQKDRPEMRFMAAQGLGQLMRVINQLRENGQVNKTASRVDATRADVMQTASDIVPVCRLGLKDAEARVRATCLDGIHLASEGLVNMIMQPFPRKDFPPEGRQLTPAETLEIKGTYDLVRPEVAEVKPYFTLLRETASHLEPALADEETAVRLAAVNALESIAMARFMQRKRLESVPLPSSEKGKIDLIQLEDPLAEFLPRGLPIIAKLLSDDDVRIRREVLNFLQNIDNDAISAVPALQKALEDPDRFVRWASARILGRLPIRDVKSAIPSLGKLLDDDDPAVRQVAALALEATGAQARDALAAILHAIVHGDVESRLAVLKVVVRLAPEDAKTAVPNLVKVLAHEDARIRKGAAETLGRLGQVAREAVPALRRLIGDYDADVRRAASDAILGIMMAPQR